MSWTAKTGLILFFTMLFTVFVYQGWYKPSGTYAVTLGPRTAGTASGTNWTTPGNTTLSDGAYAVYGNTTQDYLVLTNFGFNVPAGAIITGITVSIEGIGSGNTSAARSLSVGITTNGTSVSGTPKTFAFTSKTADTTISGGANNDAWGATLSPALVNGTSFGLLIQDADATNNSLSIDYLTVTVDYVIPTTPIVGSPTAASIGSTTATLGATVTDAGGGTLTARGTTWGTSANPTGNAVAEGGTTVNAAYSHSRTGLPAGSLVYFRGYATNNGSLTGYSGDGSFYTEPATQASNVTFPSYSQTGMTVRWNRGSGDGVIVLMKAASAVGDVPADGTYTTYFSGQNAAFNSAYTLGSSKVVYMGSGTQVAVTGLTNATTYYVAVFEYKGSANDAAPVYGTNYLTTAPAAGSQQATTPADTTPPTVGTINVSPTSTTYTSSAPTITATMTDTETAVTSCEYTVNNGGTWVPGAISGVSSPYTCTANPTNLLGPLTINMRGTSTGGTGAGTPVTTYTADASVPVIPDPLIVAPGNGQNVIRWSAATDTGSGVKQYNLRYLAGTTPPANCSAGASVYTGATLTYPHALANGSDASYRLCVSDNVDNAGPGITGSGKPVTGTADTLSATSTAIAAAATDVDLGVVMQRLTVNSTATGDGKAAVFSITMDDSGTAGQIAAVRFYISPTSSTTLPTDAVLLGGKARWDGNSREFLFGSSVTNRTITSGTPKYLYIVYDMADGQTGTTVRTHVSNLAAAAPDTGAALNLSGTSITLGNGTATAVITSCAGCHGYPTMVDSATRGTPEGSVVGSHSAHTTTCSECHFVPATTTNVDFDHRSGTIQLLTKVGYSRGTSFSQTNDMTGADLGTCSAASCHGNVYGPGTSTSPKWGTTAGCDACHSIPIGTDGPNTGGHAAHTGYTCIQCHNAGTTMTTSPTAAHADGDIDIVNVGYPANVAKHASGSGYSSCSSASCHGNVYAAGAGATPVWGSTGNGCGACHTVAIGSNGPDTGSHTAHAGTACTACHNAGTTATTSPSAAHPDTDIDVTGGYPPNVAKHAAGSYTGTCTASSCHANVYGAGYVASTVWGTPTGCENCHKTVINSYGPNTGSHLAHNTTDCSQCHAGTTTFSALPTANHMDGDIDVTGGYAANVTKHAAGSGYGSCSSATCHANVYGSGSSPSPTWGVSSGCEACHGAPNTIGTNGPPTGSHTGHAGKACTVCHNAGTTATTAPSTAHPDGLVTVLGTFSYTVTAKHAAGSGYGSCSNVGCHGTATWGGPAMNCLTCHSAALGNRRQVVQSGTAADGTPGGTGGDFIRGSRHVSNGTTTQMVKHWDCIVCHLEGNTTDGKTSASHTGTPNSNADVNLRNVDNYTTGWAWNRLTIGGLSAANQTIMRNDMDRFCITCHDSDTSAAGKVELQPNGAAATNTDGTETGVANYYCAVAAEGASSPNYFTLPATAGTTRTYPLDDISTSVTGSSITVTVSAVAKGAAAGNQMFLALVSGGTTYVGTAKSLTTSYATYSETWATNPNSGGAWTIAAINGILAGVRSNTAAVETVDEVYVTVTGLVTDLGTGTKLTTGANMGGASTITVNATNTGITTGTNLTRKLTPFNTADTQQNAKEGTAALKTLRSGRGVTDVRGQFNFQSLKGKGWASHHNLNIFEKRYTTTGAGAGIQSGAWNTAQTPKEGGAWAETTGLHCSDCHLNEVNAHGSLNTFYMLQNSSGADTAFATSNSTTSTDNCAKCHLNTTYGAGNASTATRVEHNGGGSSRCDNSAASAAKGISALGATGAVADKSGTTELACLGCHGGTGTASAETFGMIHGTNRTYNVGGGATNISKQYRFMNGGSWPNYSPTAGNTGNTDASWEGTTNFTCYTISAANAFGGCTQHASTGGNPSNRSRTLEY